MNVPSSLRLVARISLGLVFFVVLAGSIVRTTGSGMGCPDWPRCFGHYVPPTSIDPLLFQEGRTYEKGKMVIHNDTLWVANADLTAGESFDRGQWHKYPKHDHATFSAVQTWIEYLNRLATGVFAIPVLLLAVMGFRYGRRTGDKRPFWWTLGALFFIGFEAWLGKLVVDGNLHTGSVTLHMIGSLAIIVLLLAVVLHLEKREVAAEARTLRSAIIASIVLSLVQIFLGTQVREEIDIIAASGAPRGTWIDQLTPLFYVHRSFSILVVLLTAWLWKKARTIDGMTGWANTLAVVVGVEVLAGVVLAYAGMPALFQPVHLLFGVVVFSVAMAMALRLRHVRA